VLRRCKREGITVCVPPGTYAVAPTGTDAPACGTAAAPCRTIQFVVDELILLNGAGTIKVAAGTYDDLKSCPAGTAPNQAVVCVLNKQVTLLGGFAPPNWDTPADDPRATVIDGKGEGRGLRIQRTGPNEATASLEMDGFTIQNGLAQGMSSGDASQTWAFGGGMLAEHSAVALRDVVFRNNRVIGGTTSQPAGGRAAGGGLAVNDDAWSSGAANATLQTVTFEGNRAHGGSGVDQGGYALGGALFSYWVTLSGDTLVFDGNAAMAGSTSGVGFSGSDKSDALGGAVSVEQNSSVDLRHVHATGNSATGGAAPNGEAGGAFGGAFFAELAALSVTDAVIEQNRAQGGSGKNTTTTGSLAEGGGVFTVTSDLTLDRVIVVGNEARAGDGLVNGGASGGGGVAVTFGSGDGVDTPFTIRNSVIANNLVSSGSGTFVGGGAGGLWIQAVTGTIEHATIANNRLGDAHLLGGGVAVVNVPGWQAHATISDSIMANQTTRAFDPTCYSDAALYVAENTTADVTRVLFANNRHDSNAGISGGWNLPPGTVNMTGALSAPDAGFVSAGNPDDDYHLVAGSPAVDQAAGGSVAVDLDGRARPDGAAADLGAYEFTP
jgi:hypothetical protein